MVTKVIARSNTYASPFNFIIGWLEVAVGSGKVPRPRTDFFLLEVLLDVDPKPSEATVSPDFVSSGSEMFTPTSSSDVDASSSTSLSWVA
jgi:hypothetical protein